MLQTMCRRCALAQRLVDVREAFFLVPVNSRSTKWTSGRAHKKNVKPQGNAAPERQTTKLFQKSPVQKKHAIFAPLETNGRADGNQKKPSLGTRIVSHQNDESLCFNPVILPLCFTYCWNNPKQVGIHNFETIGGA